MILVAKLDYTRLRCILFSIINTGISLKGYNFIDETVKTWDEMIFS